MMFPASDSSKSNFFWNKAKTGERGKRKKTNTRRAGGPAGVRWGVGVISVVCGVVR